MKLKASFALILYLLIGYIPGSSPNAQAWFFQDSPPQFQVLPRLLIGYMLPTPNHSLNLYLPTLSWTDSNGDNITDSSSINGFLQSAKMEGLWLELDLPAKTNSPVGFTTSLGYLVPAKYRVQESYKGQQGQTASRTWQTETTLYSLKLSVDFTVTESLTGMIGFLYDSLMTNYFSPENILPANNNQWLNYAQASNVDVSIGVPFIGLHYEQPLWSRLSLRTYLIGFPGLLGAMSYQETVQYLVTRKRGDTDPISTQANTVKLDGTQQISSGYFYEAFVQLSTPVWRGFSAGAVVKYTEFSAKLDHLDLKNGITDPVMKADINYARKPLIIGANITALF